MACEGFFSSNFQFAMGSYRVCGDWPDLRSPNRRVLQEQTMMYAAVTGAILVGVFSVLGLRKAKQSRDIYYFHEE